MNLFKTNKPEPSEEKQQPESEKEVEEVSKFITENDFIELANKYGIEVAALKAIFTVEAGGKSGFLKEDLNVPVTLEEGHIFYKYMQEKRSRDSEKLSYDML